MKDFSFGKEFVRQHLPNVHGERKEEKVVYVYKNVDGHNCVIGEINEGIGRDRSVLIYHHTQHCVGVSSSIENAKQMLIDGNFDILLQDII